VLGGALKAEPASAPGTIGAFTVTTKMGVNVQGDLWLRCHGIAPVSDYLAGDLLSARTADGYLEVDEHLRVAGHANVFVVGDLVAGDSNRVGTARRHADIVAANIKAAMAGSEAARYIAAPAGIVLPLGPSGGAGESPDRGLMPSNAVARLKGGDMLVARYQELFGYA